MYRNMIPKTIIDKLPRRVRKRIDILCGIIKENDHILDIGCGTGAFVIRPISYLPVKIVAIDCDEKSIGYAYKYNAHSNVRYIVADGETYKSENKFDLVICSHILEHVKSPTLLLENLRLLVKHDGLLFLGLPNGYGSFEIENFLPRMAYRTKSGERLINKIRHSSIKDSMNDSQHIGFYSYNAIKKLLNDSGWHVVRQVNEEFLGGMITARLLSLFPKLAQLNTDIADRLPPMLSNSWVFICKKEIK